MSAPALASVAGAIRLVKVGHKFYRYLEDDAKNRFMLEQPYYATLYFTGPVYDALKSGGRFDGRFGGLEYLPEHDGVLLGILDGYKWNGADLVPDQKHDVPEDSAWGSEFLSSLEHDFLLEFRKKIAAQLEVSVRSVEDFAHALFAHREKQFGKPWRGKVIAHSMKAGYPVFTKVRRWAGLACLVLLLAAASLATGCAFEHKFDDRTPPMERFYYTRTNTTYGANIAECLKKEDTE